MEFWQYVHIANQRRKLVSDELKKIKFRKIAQTSLLGAGVCLGMGMGMDGSENSRHLL